MGAAPWLPTARDQEAMDEACCRAAEALLRADVLLVFTGAGFSADSGLPVYRDIAAVEAYQEKGLSYKDLCNPSWLHQEPEVFYGFWGSCFNSYRDAEPHEGYGVLQRWRDEHFSRARSGTAKRIQTLLAKRERARYVRQTKTAVNGACNKVGGEVVGNGCHAGAFYMYTSNVDAHSFDYFEPCEVRECHGNLEFWQCGQAPKPCCRRTWRAPLDFRFRVDAATMRAAPSSIAALEAPLEAPLEASLKASLEASLETRPKAGDVDSSAGRRRRLLVRLADSDRVLSAEVPTNESPRAESAHTACSFRTEGCPLCPHCGGPARPAVCMFEDVAWVDAPAQEARWKEWRHAVAVAAQARLRSALPRQRLLVFEIGCGCDVRTVRHMVEQVAGGFAGVMDVTVVRVNPDRTGVGGTLLQSLPTCAHVEIPCGGLEALLRIDEHFGQLIQQAADPESMWPGRHSERGKRRLARKAGREAACAAEAGRRAAASTAAVPLRAAPRPQIERAVEAAAAPRTPRRSRSRGLDLVRLGRAESSKSELSASAEERVPSLCCFCKEAVPGQQSPQGIDLIGISQEVVEAVRAQVPRDLGDSGCACCWLAMHSLFKSRRHPRHLTLAGLALAVLDEGAVRRDFNCSRTFQSAVASSPSK